MAKGKALIALGLVIALPEMLKNPSKTEAVIRAEKAGIEYLVEWPFNRAYSLAVKESDKIDAILNYTFYEIGLRKNLENIASEISYAKTKKEMERYILKLEKSTEPLDNIMAYKIGLTEYLAVLREKGLKQEENKFKKKLASMHASAIRKLDEFIPYVPSEYYRNECLKMKEGLIEKAKKEGIIH